MNNVNRSQSVNLYSEGNHSNIYPNKFIARKKGKKIREKEIGIKSIIKRKILPCQFNLYHRFNWIKVEIVNRLRTIVSPKEDKYNYKAGTI